MMTNYYAGQAPSQDSIVMLVFGSLANAPATVNQCAYAFTQITGMNVNRFGTLSAAEVQSQIDAYHPLLLRLAWNGGGGHYVVCAGYSSYGGTLRIIDPAVGCRSKYFSRSAMINNTQFESGYGRWVEGMNGY